MTRSGDLMKSGPRPHFRTIALIVGAAVFMEQMDGTILATALPGMARDLGVSAPSLSIALTSYLISLAIFIPASGWLADRLGGRRLFRFSILFFTAASILGGFAPPAGHGRGDDDSGGAAAPVPQHREARHGQCHVLGAGAGPAGPHHGPAAG